MAFGINSRRTREWIQRKVLLIPIFFLIHMVGIDAQHPNSGYIISVGMPWATDAWKYDIDEVEKNWSVSFDYLKIKRLSETWALNYGAGISYERLTYQAVQENYAPEIDEIVVTVNRLDSRKALSVSVQTSLERSLADDKILVLLGIAPRVAVARELFSDVAITRFYHEFSNGGYAKYVPPRESRSAFPQHWGRLSLDLKAELSFRVVRNARKSTWVFARLNGNVLREDLSLRTRRFVASVGLAFWMR